MSDVDTTESPSDRQAQAAVNRAADVRHAARGGGTNLLAMIAGLLLPAYHTMITRLFGAATYGLYSLALGVVEVAQRLCPAGTDKGLLRHIPYHRIAGERSLEQRALTTAVWLTFGFGAFLALCLVGLAGLLSQLQRNFGTTSAIRLLAPSVPFGALIVVLVSATMGAKVMRFNLYVRGLGQPLALLVCAIPVALIRPSITGLCVAHLVATVIVAGFAFWAAASVFGKGAESRLFRSGPPHWSMVRFSAPLGATEFLNALISRVDLVLLSLFVDEVGLGIYAAAELLSRLISNARYAFDPVASPVLAESLREGDLPRVRYNLQLMTRWVALLTFPLVIFLAAARRDVLLLFGPDFVAASHVLLIFCVGQLFNSLLGLTGWVVLMAGHSGLILIDNLVCVAVNAMICLALIPRYGLAGAAAGAAGATALLVLLLLGAAIVKERVHPFSVALLKVTAAGGGTLVLAELLIGYLPGPAIVRVVLGALGIVAVYAVLLVVLGLTEEERALLGRLRDKLGRPRR